MSRKKRTLRVVLLAGLSFFFTISMCLAQMKDPITDSSKPRILIAQVKSPPWAPSQGQTAVYQYLYYPRSSVYFDTGRELYFFITNGQWIKAPTLPPQVRQNLGDFVILTMDTSEPYRFHSDVARYYSAAGQTRQTEKLVSPSQVLQTPADTPTAAPLARGVKISEKPKSAMTTPPWAPAVGESSYQYRYYPDSFVYFDTVKNVYYYRENNQWLESDTLPAYIADNMGSPVLLNMNTDKPYRYHSEVVERYPHPGYNKNVQKIIKIRRETYIKD